MLPSTSYLIWSMQLQSLNLLRPTVYEEMHLQEIALFDRDTKRCPVSPTSYDLCSYKVWICYVRRFMRRCIYKKLHYLTVTRNVAQYLLPHVTYADTKFEFATFNRIGDAFPRNATEGQPTDRL